jgi:hypothetical protein
MRIETPPGISPFTGGIRRRAACFPPGSAVLPDRIIDVERGYLTVEMP